jgi:FG-GAP-like repeat
MTSRTPAALLFPVALVGLIAAQVASRPLVHAQAPGAGTTEFVAHEIGTGLRGGYQVVIADLNKDGKPDIIALASGVPDLVWYENPGWQRHVLAGEQSQLINTAAYDIDGDGIPELAVAQGFTTTTKTSKGIVSILTHGADVTQPWTAKEIDRVPTAHRLRWIDADGSGKKMLVMAPLIGMDSAAPDYKTPVSIYFYRAPDWKREVVTDSFTGLIHGIEPMAWEGVKGQALMSAGFMGVYLHRFASGTWTPAEMTKGDPEPWPKSGTSDVALGKLGAQRFIATIEPWHGNQIVIYKPGASGWARQMIDDTITDGHSVVTVDVDGDGRDEVVAGQRGGARSLMLYTASADGASWTKRAIDEGGMAGAGCAAADLNADKRMDIVCIGTATANLKWYENVGKK